jgi:hypothetical protein
MNQINRNRILECLKELSDGQLQENLWTGKIPSQQSSFVEVVEGLFTDSGLGGDLSKGKTGFSAAVETKLHELEHQLAKIDAKGGPTKVINDPAMPRVRDLAAGTLELLEHEMNPVFLPPPSKS